MLKKSLMFSVMFLLCMSIVYGACSYDTTVVSKDYFGLNRATYNYTYTMNSSQYFNTLINMTPRLNFSRTVNDTILGKGAGGNSSLAWITPVNITSTLFLLYNGSTLVNESNYTVFSMAGGLYGVAFVDGKFNGDTLRAVYNVTFVKNHHDLIANPSGLYRGATASDWVELENDSSSYGVTPGFKFNDATLNTYYFSDSNWVVDYRYTTKSSECYTNCTGVNGTLFNVLSTFFMIGMIVFIAFFALKGGFDFKLIVGAVVVFLVLLVGLGLLRGVISSVCG